MYRIGIDLGGTNIKAGIVDKNGKIVKSMSTKTKKGVDAIIIIKDMIDLVNKLISSFGISINDVLHIGIGVPGIANNETGVVVKAVNISFSDVRIREEMQKYFDVPIYIANDANCAALAESLFGEAKGVKNSITITIGTGIGGGIIINNEIYEGSNFAGGELGHISLIMDGKPCGCGRKGCFEAYASATALKNQAMEVVSKNKNTTIYNKVSGDINRVEARVVFECAKRNDKVAEEIVDNYIKYLTEGIITLINIFQPDVIAIGGGVSNAGDYFLNKVRKVIKNSNEMAKELEKRTVIKLAKLGNDAGIIGSAFLK